jgi:hypothetical protein
VKGRFLAVAAAWAWLGPCVAAQPPAETVLSLPEYVGVLEELSDRLRAADLEEARSRAHDLLDCRVDSGRERLATDATVLGRVAEVKDASAARGLAEEVASLAGALASQAQAAPAPAGDAGRLERLRREAEARALRSGGTVEPGRPPTLTESVRRSLEAVADKVRRGARAVFEWLERFWPRPRRPRDPSAPAATSVTTVALVTAVAVGLGLLAFHALRRWGREPEQDSSPAPASSSRDADPLSREADEWERYARELASAGRAREAIRAVYHAVLMTLFRAGVLHHQKGRTNWEYVARLPPEAATRAGFMRLTRAFDREWYGRDRSSAEAFAECAEEAGTLVRMVREA